MSEVKQVNRKKLKGAKKVFSKTFGEVYGNDKQILQRLSKDVHLTKVKSVEKCDISLAFCPIVSRIGTDITAVLEKCNELGILEKRLILVVLHHTFMSDYTVPDISRHVTRENILAVDFLFHSSSGGLLDCRQNNKAFRQISSEFCSKKNASKSAQRHEESQPADKDEVSQPAFLAEDDKGTKKVFSKAFGEVLQRLSKDVNLTKVESVEECDIILAFCPIVSCIATDIKAFLKKCNELGMLEKRLILVVLHTLNPDYNVPDISRHVTIENVLTVDFLFHSSSGGLLGCPQNDKSLRQIEVEMMTSEVMETHV